MLLFNTHMYMQAKDIAHIWELGGGTFLSKLVSIPITAPNLRYVLQGEWPGNKARGLWDMLVW